LITDHVPNIAGSNARLPAAIIKIIAAKLREDHEGPVNGFTTGFSPEFTGL
jgi:hypothetical protein